ncbi:hypothetical protein EMIT0P100_10521 [Pseudomonas sp. IT-P100]
MLAKAFEQFEAGYTRRRLDVLQVDVFAGVAFYEILCAHQVIRQLDAQLITKFGAVVIGLGKDEPLDQRAFDIAGEKHLTEQVVTALQLIDVVTGQPPPGGRGAVDRIHHRLELQRHFQRALQHAFQCLAHGHAGDHHGDLVTVTGHAQCLGFVRCHDQSLILIGVQPTAILDQLLLAANRQAEAVAIEVFGILDANGHVCAVFHPAQGRGHGFEDIGLVVKLNPVRLRGLQFVRPANAGHPRPGTSQVVAIYADISKLDNIWFGHDGAPTAMNIDTLFGAYSHWICKGYAQPVRTGEIRTFRPVIGNYLDIERVARP